MAEASARHPQYASLIEAFDSRWEKMLAGPIHGTVDLLDSLRQRAVPLYALTNWSRDKFPVARARFDFLAWFDGIVVSGEEGLVKPDPAIFHRLTARHGLKPSTTLFIDDSEKNVVAARDLGFQTHHFRSPESLGAALAGYGLL